jgi:hypothetical protein
LRARSPQRFDIRRFRKLFEDCRARILAEHPCQNALGWLDPLSCSLPHSSSGLDGSFSRLFLAIIALRASRSPRTQASNIRHGVAFTRLARSPFLPAASNPSSIYEGCSCANANGSAPREVTTMLGGIERSTLQRRGASTRSSARRRRSSMMHRWAPRHRPRSPSVALP